MKIVFDTNVIIDAVAMRKPFCADATRVLLMVSEEKLEGCLTANSVTDIFYVIRRNLDETASREVIRSLLYSLDVIEVNGADCSQALHIPVDDYEDALLAACAEKTEADYIISRDEDFIKSSSSVPVISPASFLAITD